MKKITTLTGGMFFVLAVSALAWPTPIVHADELDGEAISAVSTALDQLATFTNESTNMSSEDFFPAFVEKADTTRQEVSRAYATLGRTSETEEAKLAVESVRASLSDIKRDLSALQESAQTSDGTLFDEKYKELDADVAEYNKDIQEYSKAAALAESDARMPGFFSMALLAIVVVLPFVLKLRSKNLAKRAKNTTIADNAKLAVSTKMFIVLNVLTLGFYSAYWAWKSWEIIIKAESKNYHSTLRAWFFIFTSFSLFDKIEDLANETGYKRNFRPTLLAAGYFVVVASSNAIWMALQNLALLGVVDIVCVTISTLLLLPVVKAQRHFVAHTQKQLAPLGKDSSILFLIVVAIVVTVWSVVTMVKEF